MWRTRAEAVLEAQVADLKQRLDREQDEKRALLDRLLARNNVSPINEPPKATAPVIEIISPFGSVTPEMEVAVQESAIAEEAGYLMETQGLDAQRAQQEARKRFTEMYAVGMRQ